MLVLRITDNQNGTPLLAIIVYSGTRLNLLVVKHDHSMIRLMLKKLHLNFQYRYLEFENAQESGIGRSEF